MEMAKIFFGNALIGDNPFQLLLITLGILVLIILLMVALGPFMALFNIFNDKKYNADEKDLLVGRLTVGIDSIDSVGEVTTQFVDQAMSFKPAKIYHQAGKEISSIEKNTQVLIVEVRRGIAYVIPYD